MYSTKFFMTDLDFTSTLLDLIAESDKIKSSKPSEKHPNMDVYKKEDGYYLEMALPGVKKENLTVKLEGNYIMIEGKREKPEIDFIDLNSFYGTYKKRVQLPETADRNNIKSKYLDGILTIKIGFKEKQVQDIVIE